MVSCCSRQAIHRKSAILASAVLLFLGLPAFSQREPDWANVQVKLQKLAPNFYMIEFVSPNGGNAGANASVLVGDDGVLLVDAGYGPVAPKLEAAIKTISDKPVKYLLNTHWHGDHTGADAYFGKTAVIIAQENARKRMQSGDDPAHINRTNLLREIFPAFPPVALPIITFDDQLTLRMNGEEVRAIHFARGHTDSDCVVFFMQAKVAQTGTDFVNMDPPGFPAIDMDNDGTGARKAKSPLSVTSWEKCRTTPESSQDTEMWPQKLRLAGIWRCLRALRQRCNQASTMERAWNNSNRKMC